MNFTAVCRTCLTTQNLNPIFAGSVDDKRYSVAVFVTTGIKVAIDDGLPQQMCARCISFSNASLKFRKQCKDAETRLLQVKHECDGAAETLHSGAVGSEGFSDKDMRLELKAEEDHVTDDSNVTIKIEADSEVEDIRSGNDNDMIWAAPECTHTRPEEGPPCSTGHKQQFKLRSCFVRLERFPIEDLHHNMHTCKTCLMTFDCELSLRNHSCTTTVQESNLNEVCNEIAKKLFKCDLCGKQYVQKRHIIRHLAAHNVQQGDEKLVPYSFEDDKFANTEEISYSDNVSKTHFKDQSDLTIHTGERHGPHICDVSSKEFSEKQHLIRHLTKLHRDETSNMTDKYICDMCKKCFGHLPQLTSHFPEENPFTCDVCKKLFTQSGHLAKTRRIHTGEKPYCCCVCNKQFAQRHNFSRHMRIHTGEKPFTCDVCKAQFARKGHLIRHITMHTGEKRYSCDVCKKEFADKCYLTIHVRIHTGQKPFTCAFCQKQFAQKGHLTRHITMHTGEKRYSCNVCKKKISQKSNLTVHMRIHTGEKPFTCDVCKKQFARKGDLTRHKMRMHTA